MLKKLDNTHSFSMSEFIEEASKPRNEIQIIKEYEKYILLIKKHLTNDKYYDDWIKYINQQIHLSLPDEVKDNCKKCKGDIKSENEKAFEIYYIRAGTQLSTSIMFYVSYIENNSHLFKSKELILELTYKFFEHFRFNNGELSFDGEAFDNILLNQTILLLRELYSKMKTKEAIKKLNESLEDLETHKVMAKFTDRILFDFTNPQIKFFKKQLRYYEKKLLTESLSNNKPIIDESVKYDEYPNVFQKSMPIQVAVDHFQIFTIKNSKNGKPFLTDKEFDIFIKKAFCGMKDLPKQSFNKTAKGEKFIIQHRFREFYDNYCDYFGTGQVTDVFIKLLTDNFSGWDYNNVKNNFNKKPKITIDLL